MDISPPFDIISHWILLHHLARIRLLWTLSWSFLKTEFSKAVLRDSCSMPSTQTYGVLQDSKSASHAISCYMKLFKEVIQVYNGHDTQLYINSICLPHLKRLINTFLKSGKVGEQTEIKFRQYRDYPGRKPSDSELMGSPIYGNVHANAWAAV